MSFERCRRNEISNVHNIGHLQSLQRVFLSNNKLTSFENILCLFELASLSELALDGNAVSENSNYRDVLIENIPALRYLIFDCL